MVRDLHGHIKHQQAWNSSRGQWEPVRPLQLEMMGAKRVCEKKNLAALRMKRVHFSERPGNGMNGGWNP